MHQPRRILHPRPTVHLPPNRPRGDIELDVPRIVDELDNCVRRVVAFAPPELVYTRVPSFSGRVAVREESEELLEELGFQEEALQFTRRGKVFSTLLSEGDNLG